MYNWSGIFVLCWMSFYDCSIFNNLSWMMFTHCSTRHLMKICYLMRQDYTPWSGTTLNCFWTTLRNGLLAFLVDFISLLTYFLPTTQQSLRLLIYPWHSQYLRWSIAPFTWTLVPILFTCGQISNLSSCSFIFELTRS